MKKIFNILFLFFGLFVIFGISKQADAKTFTDSAGKLSMTLPDQINTRKIGDIDFADMEITDMTTIFAAKYDAVAKSKNNKICTASVHNEEYSSPQFISLWIWNKLGTTKVYVTVTCRGNEYDYVTGRTSYQTYSVTGYFYVNVTGYNSFKANADIDDYNTSTNIFEMSVTNLSNKKIVIYSKDAMAYDDDYRTYDRRLRLKNKSKVVVKPGQEKVIKFKVIGSPTWWNEEDFQICSYWKWRGKKYWVSVHYDNDDFGLEVFKKVGRKWKRISVDMDK